MLRGISRSDVSIESFEETRETRSTLAYNRETITTASYLLAQSLPPVSAVPSSPSRVTVTYLTTTPHLLR